MTRKKYELTKEGLQNLQNELELLKNVKRAEVIEAIKEARAQGDLSENADYDTARNEQAKIEARIKELDEIIKHHKIIEVTADNIVNIGKKVKIFYENKKEERLIELVGSLESNPRENKISIDSPLGRALKLHKENEVVTVKTNSGKVYNVKIIEVI